MSNPFFEEDNEVAACKKLDGVLAALDFKKPNRLSPSTLNDFITNRGGWFYKKIAKQGSFETAPYFIRGQAVEAGIVSMLKSRDKGLAYEDRMATALSLAGKHFDDAETGHFNEKQKEELKQHRLDLEGYIAKGTEALGIYGPLLGTQKEIKVEIKGCSIPFYGFIDFLFESCVVDTKVVAKKPSGLTQGYCIQGTVYFLATRLPVYFEHLVKTCPKTGAVFSNYREDVRKQSWPMPFWVDYIQMAAKAMEGAYDCILSGDTVSLFKHLCFPDIDAFYESEDQNQIISFWRKLQ